MAFANVGFTNTTLTVQESSGTTAIQVDLVDSAGAFGAVITTVTLDYAVTGGTATAGVDFAALGGTLVFTSAGSQTFDLTLLQDLDFGSDETIVITLSNCIEFQLDGPGTGPCGTFSGDFESDPGIFINSSNPQTITITDTTSPGIIDFSNAPITVDEGGTAVVTATRTGGSDGAVSVSFTTADGTAIAGSDYTANSGTLTWADGDSTAKTFTVTALTDIVIDANETFTATLSNPTGNATIGGSPVETITINDTTAPGTINFSSTTDSVLEGQTVTITASRTNGSDGAVTIDFLTANGTAIAGTDYTATSGTLSWADGDATDKSFTVTTLNDTEIEANETFTATLSNETGGATLGSDSVSSISIVDTTTPGTISLSSAIATVAEGGVTIITASRTGGIDGIVTIDFATADISAVAGIDYTAASGTLTWADGDNTDKTFTISALTDVISEEDETLSATLSNVTGGATIGNIPVATVTITDGTIPGTIAFSSASASISEGGTATINVSRTGGSDGVVTVDFATADGTALAGSDYTATSGTLTWTDGDILDKTFTITALADTLLDPNETLSANLSNVTGGATLGSASTTITITDTTAPGTINFTSATASVVEGNTSTITVSRTGGSDGAVSIDFATADISAVAGTDYTATTGTLTWADGDTSDKTFTLTALEDGVVDEEETFSVTLSNLIGNATIGSVATVTILIVETSQQLSEITGLNPEQQSVATAIDELCNGATGALLEQCLNIIASDLTDEELITIIDAITPAQISAQGSNAIDFGFQQLQVVHGRIVNLRQKNKNGERISLAGFTMNSYGKQIPIGKMAQSLLYSALDEEGGDQPLRDSPLGFFLKGNITLGEKESTASERGFDVDSKSITFGLDYQFSDALVLGIASGYANSHNDFANNGGEMESHSGNFSIYGSYFLPHDFYIDMILSYAIHNYDNSRTISFPGLQASATSDTFGDQYGGSLGFGKDFFLKDFFISPYARIEYLRTGIDEYTEQGGGVFALRVNEQSMFSLASTLGGQINKSISMPWGIISPGIRFEWRHQFRDDQRRIQSQFINAPAGTGFFSIRTNDPDRDYFNLGGSIAITLPEGKSAFLRYESRLGQDDITNHTIEAAIRIPF